MRVEQGSRAWGFASPDSDYDVRYVFIRPIKDYLRIDPLPDHIDGPLDEVQDYYSRWDIKKAHWGCWAVESVADRMAVFPGCVAVTTAWHGGHFADCADAYFRWSGICIISMRRRIAHGEISWRANRCG